MNLIERNFRDQLAAHYSAIRARLLTPPPPPPPPPPPIKTILPVEPEPDTTQNQDSEFPSAEKIAAKWREIDERMFGGRVSPKAVIQVTSAYFEISVAELMSDRRRRKYVEARYTAMRIMRMLCKNCVGPISICQIGRLLNRDHSSVLYACKRTIRKDEFAKGLDAITQLLKRK